jgi:hypothetical protein
MKTGWLFYIVAWLHTIGFIGTNQFQFEAMYSREQLKNLRLPDVTILEAKSIKMIPSKDEYGPLLSRFRKNK